MGGISFDYGHVLGGLDLEELRDRLGASASAVTAMRKAMPAAYRMHDAAIDRGEGHEAAWRALMDTLVAAAGVLDRASAVDALWRAQPTRNLWRFVPDEARALLDDLTRAGVPMVITSNSEGRVRELLTEVSIAHHFVSILDSGVLGFAKPDRRIFEHAAAAMSLSPADMIHVGDSEAADIAGAKAFGAYAIRFDAFVPGAHTRPTLADARASTFSELRTHLFTALARVR
jgi:putative hydrolase of the HAD superfamily